MNIARYILTVSCDDAHGIVAAVSGFISGKGGFIVESTQFGDPDTKRFFMRMEFEAGTQMPARAQLEQDFVAQVAEPFAMQWHLYDTSIKPRVVVCVSKIGHCLNDLLHRWRTGGLNMEIPAVISNHDDMRSIVEWHGIPYHHLPVSKETKAEQEAQMWYIIEEVQADTVVLARYMQVLSADLCAKLVGRAINIHHSFLPSFKGAKPYHQAHARGVKLIGATAHYVTSDLDEGPIIEQEAIRVNHSHSAEELVRRGQDIESSILSRALRLHLQHRVLLNGSKTVVFG